MLSNKEKFVIVGLRTPDQTPEFFEESMIELDRLVFTAGGETIARLDQNLKKPVSATFIGKGKLEQLAEILQMEECQSVVFDDDLKPNQARNIEKALGEEIKVLDRSGLILDIFATRARSTEARIQVELAQLEYLRPRLTGMWQHLSRQYGGSIGARGPGETQLETDKRVLSRRIAMLKGKLEKIERQRENRRKRRRGQFRIALLGYTNAGKSTLLNALTHSDAHVEDKLFATLDPRTRTYYDAWGRRLLFTDTVGFIRKLPHHLVESFRSTLAEAQEADILLIVADSCHHALKDHLAVVHKELDRMGLRDRPSQLILNKVDLAEDIIRAELARNYPEAVFISSTEGEGVQELLESILERAPIRNAGGKYSIQN